MNKVVGTNVTKIDAVKLARGEPVFTDDHRPPGMLYAKVLRSPHAHARILEVDATAALAVDGVVDVIWHQDTLNSRDIATAARRFEIPGGRFDIILAMSILHHLPDWAAAYWAVRGASKLAFIEVPNPLEQRHGRPSKLDHKLPSLDALVQGEAIGTAPGWKSNHLRDIRLVSGGRPQGIPAWVMSGNGVAQRNLPKLDSSVLGYVPVPGTLNLDTTSPIMPEEDPDIIPSHRGEYRVWPVRLNGIPAHIYRPPRARSWSHMEIVAPVQLRTVLAIDDGDVVFLELEKD